MKTNHQRQFKERQRAFSNYTTVAIVRIALDGQVVNANANCGDHTNGKHGIAKDRRGAKKFVHSRIRRKDRDFLIKQNWD